MTELKLVRILGVDDDRYILNSLRRILVEHDCVFIDACSGAEGLEIMQLGGLFDVVISDYRMPGMSGIEFLTEVRRIQPETKRILLTGQAPEREIEEALKSTIVHIHLHKPWETDELLASIGWHPTR